MTGTNEQVAAIQTAQVKFREAVTEQMVHPTQTHTLSLSFARSLSLSRSLALSRSPALSLTLTHTPRTFSSLLVHSGVFWIRTERSRGVGRKAKGPGRSRKVLGKSRRRRCASGKRSPSRWSTPHPKRERKREKERKRERETEREKERERRVREAVTE